MVHAEDSVHTFRRFLVSREIWRAGSVSDRSTRDGVTEMRLCENLRSLTLPARQILVLLSDGFLKRRATPGAPGSGFLPYPRCGSAGRYLTGSASSGQSQRLANRGQEIRDRHAP